jgi:hypothetical protein
MARKVSKKKTTKAKKATRKVKATSPRGMAKKNVGPAPWPQF